MNSKLTFGDLGLSADLLKNLEKKGYIHPTPVQEKTIPLLLSGEKDIVAQAQTGTGKTAAFCLPILERLTPGLGKVQAIIMTPTRELAMQVCQELDSLRANRNFITLPVYGGQGMDTQLRALRRGVDIVVATPGRAIDHINRKTLKLDHVKYVVLDEADEMLNMGFVDDIETILSHVPGDRKMLLFSATMPYQIMTMAKKFMGEFNEIRIQTEQQPVATVEQVFYEMYEKDKLRALIRLNDTEPEFYALVFCRTRIGSDRLAEKLNKLGLDVEALHGDVSQNQRERILAKFKGGHATILVATDVAARGLDVNNLSHVINFDLPDSPEAYIHRIGRTGRAGKSGKAISFVSPGDFGKIQAIMRHAKTIIRKEALPSGQTVIELKRNAMASTVYEAAKNEVPQEYHTLAQEILASAKPKQLLASLLQLHFGGKLNASAFPEIEEPNRREPSWKSRDTGSRPSYKGGQRNNSQRSNSGLNKKAKARMKNRALTANY